jgi:hypothetical protein
MKARRKEPLRTFIFRVCPEATPQVWRTVELTEKHTLHDLNKALHQAFGMKGKNLYAFYLSGKRLDIETEYGGPSSNTPRKAIKTPLNKAGLEKGKAFLCLYDFRRENCFRIEWIDEQLTQPKTSYPRVIEKAGEPETDDPALEEIIPEPLRKWAQKVSPVVHIWTLNPQKSRGPKEVQQALALVKETREMLSKMGPEIWPVAEELAGMHLVDWILSLPADFTRRGMPEEALQVCDDFSAYADKRYFLCEKALVYAQVGRKQRALEQIRENLTAFPHDLRVITKIAEAFWKLDQAGQAERLFRKALDMAEDDINERERILEKLVAMLREHERLEEVAELIRTELDRG